MSRFIICRGVITIMLPHHKMNALQEICPMSWDENSNRHIFLHIL